MIVALIRLLLGQRRPAAPALRAPLRLTPVACPHWAAVPVDGCWYCREDADDLLAGVTA